MNPLPPKQQRRLDQLREDLKRGGWVDYDTPDHEPDHMTDAAADREYATDADIAADAYEREMDSRWER